MGEAASIRHRVMVTVTRGEGATRSEGEPLQFEGLGGPIVLRRPAPVCSVPQPHARDRAAPEAPTPEAAEEAGR